MKKLKLLIPILFITLLSSAQTLHLKTRKIDALGGKAFALSISDSLLSLKNREKIIFKEIKSGNIPPFLRKLVRINDSLIINGKRYKANYFVLPDYFAIGNDSDFFYVPMTPILAQKIAKLTKSSLPTKKMVDGIYQKATIKLKPLPIPPSKLMTTVPFFMSHTDSIIRQIEPFLTNHIAGHLTAGNKKDIIISNKIYGESTPRVVIYGWHKMDGKPIQPIYNKHTNTWADYSHGVRLIQNKISINGKKITLKKALRDVELNQLFSDEGIIKKPNYPFCIHY